MTPLIESINNELAELTEKRKRIEKKIADYEIELSDYDSDFRSNKIDLFKKKNELRIWESKKEEKQNESSYLAMMNRIDELTLEEPEIVRQGGQYGVRLSASAPSLHIMRANIHTELSPTVGSEQQGEELIKSLLADFETDPGKLWSTNIFGKSLNELVSEGVQAKLLHMPQEARSRLQQTLERIINEGCDGLICILL